MFIEKHLPQLQKDIDEIEKLLRESMPEQIKSGIEAELRRLKEAQAVLSGIGEKSHMHQLRATLRWRRQAYEAETNPARRKLLQSQLKELEQTIERESAARK